MKSVLRALLTLLPIVIAGIAIEQIIITFPSIDNVKLIIFANLIGYGFGVLTSLVVITIESIFSSRLDSLVGIIFWFGAYFSLTFGGIGGVVIGVGCAIFTILQIKLN
jgi:hypothetical protein